MDGYATFVNASKLIPVIINSSYVNKIIRIMNQHGRNIVLKLRGLVYLKISPCFQSYRFQKKDLVQ